MKVTLFTEAGLDTGYGHFYRCVSICQALFDKKIRYALYVNGNLPNDLKKEKNFHKINWLVDNIEPVLRDSDIIVIDSYKATKKFYDNIASMKPLVIYDDNNRLSYPKGLIINGGLNAKKLPYVHGKDRIYLLGSRYTPLRQVYRRVKREKIIQKEIRNVLISVNSCNADTFVQKLLSRINKTYINAKCYMVNSAQNARYYGEKDIFNTMIKCDVAISSSGQILHELIRVGLPTIAIGIADNQKNNILYASKKKLIDFVGWIDDSDLLNKIENSMIRMRDYSIRNRMHTKMISTLDGMGSYRIADAIIHYYENFGSHK